MVPRARLRDTFVAAGLGLAACIVTFALHRGFVVRSEATSEQAVTPEAALRNAASAEGDALPIGALEAERHDAEAVPRPADASRRRPAGAAPVQLGDARFGEGESTGTPVPSPAEPPRHVIDERNAVHAAALRHPSASFRNASLLAIIREAGHVCTELVSSAAGGDAGAAWRVSCDGAQAFLVYEDENGRLYVEALPFIESPVQGVIGPESPPTSEPIVIPQTPR